MTESKHAGAIRFLNCRVVLKIPEAVPGVARRRGEQDQDAERRHYQADGGAGCEEAGDKGPGSGFAGGTLGRGMLAPTSVGRRGRPHAGEEPGDGLGKQVVGDRRGIDAALAHEALE